MPINDYIQYMTDLFNTPRLDDLRTTFNMLANSEYNGVRGVMCFDSGKIGPTVGIGVMTHGNEPAGLALLWYFLNEKPLDEALNKGKVIFTLNAFDAATHFFENSDSGYDKHMQNSRFIDVNMNRLPFDLLGDANEVRRARELLPIWREFDIALDIHSTSQESAPMIVPMGNWSAMHIEGFPIEHLLSGFAESMDDASVGHFYGKNENTPMYFIETGSHESVLGFSRAIICGRALLYNIGLIDDKVEHEVEEYHHFKVIHQVYFPDESYEQVKIFPNFANISKGEVIGVGDGEPVVSPCNGHVIMGPTTLRPPNYDEAVVFITEPMEKVKF